MATAGSTRIHAFFWGGFSGCTKTWVTDLLKRVSGVLSRFNVWIDICAHSVTNRELLCLHLWVPGVFSYAGCADLMFEMLVDFSNFLKRRQLKAGKSTDTSCICLGHTDILLRGKT